MADIGDETVPCHYCGADIDVPAERSRFEVFTTHFEAEHIRADADGMGEIRRWRADTATETRGTGN